MQIKKPPTIWKYIFLIGFYLTIVHYVRFLYSFFSGYIAFHEYYIDYSYFSISSLLIRLFSFLFTLNLYKQKSRFPITSTAIVWFVLWILLSHEHDRYTFLIIPVIFIYCIFNIIFHKNINK